MNLLVDNKITRFIRRLILPCLDCECGKKWRSYSANKVWGFAFFSFFFLLTLLSSLLLSLSLFIIIIIIMFIKHCLSSEFYPTAVRHRDSKRTFLCIYNLQHKYMLFTGRRSELGNCARGLEHSFFSNTDRHRLVNNIFFSAITQAGDLATNYATNPLGQSD